jgi:hypothetical protein
MDDAIARLAELLAGASIDYALIGGHAVNVWLEPRFTADVDVTVAAAPVDVERLKAALVAEGYALAREHGADLPSGPDFIRFVSSDGTIALEIQTAKTDFQRDVVRRACTTEGPIRVATPEDLIVMKLIANRAKDRIDLEGLVRLAALDWDYVERRALEWGVGEALNRVRQRRAPSP